MPAKKPTYDAATQYRVELTERIELLGQVLYPGHDLTLRGDVLATVPADKIATATPVQQAPAEG